MTAALAAEWRKLRSVRSTHYALGAVAATLLLAALMAWNGARGWDTGDAEQRASWERVQPLEQMNVQVVQVCLAVLGVLTITSEYATGMIRASLVAVPRRRTVFTAKAGVVAAVSLAAALAVAFATHLCARLIIGDRPLANYDSPVSDAIPLLLALALSTMVVALVGLGLGTVLRSTAGGIVAVCALLFVLPVMAVFLSDPWDRRINGVMLPSLGAQLAGTASDPPLSEAGALAVMAVYVAVALGAGAVAFVRRDP